MYFHSTKISLLLLGITAITFSRIMFLFFNDPEGPNLLVVMGTAAIVYAASLLAYVFFPSLKQAGLQGFLPVALVQLLLVAGLYFLLS